MMPGQAEKIGYGYVNKLGSIRKAKKILERIGDPTCTYNSKILDNGTAIVYPLKDVAKAYDIDIRTLEKYFGGCIVPVNYAIPEEDYKIKGILFSQYMIAVIQQFREVKNMIDSFDSPTKKIAKIILA